MLTSCENLKSIAPVTFILQTTVWQCIVLFKNKNFHEKETKAKFNILFPMKVR